MKRLLLVMSCVMFAAQAAPPRDNPEPRATGTAVVRGRITSAARGEPLHRVRVTLNGQGANPPTAVTDTRGEFDITGIAAGTYSISAARAGYLTIQYGQRRPHETGRTIEVGPGQLVENINIALPRASVLSGVVLDDLGDMAPGMRLEALEFRYVRGRRIPVQAASTMTNDLGQFRLSGLSPGMYMLRATSAETWEADDGQSSYAFTPTYYPGVTGTDQAESVNLGVGQELSNLNFGLRPGRTARVTGTMQTADGTPMAMQSISLSRAIRGVGDAPFLLGYGGGPVRTDRNGSFEIRNLAPGEYVAYSGADANRVAVTVLVSEGEAQHVTLMPRKPTAVSGSIITDEGTPAPFQSALLRVTPVAADPESLLPSFTGPSAASVNRDWTFRFANMDGQYLFRVTGLPAGWMLATVSLSGRNITDTPLTVRPGGADVTGLQVVLSGKGGKIDGHVVNPDSTPAADSTIIVFAADSVRWTLASRFVRAVRPDNAGRFVVAGLPAGMYATAARDFVADGQWEDPAFLRGLMPQAVRFELAEGGSHTLTLRLEPQR